MDLRGKFRGSLLAAAVGDALGELKGGGNPPSSMDYTDDTAETLVVARHLAANCKVVAEDLARELAEEWRREPWRGYGPGPPRIFRRILNGEGPLGLDVEIYPGGSLGNGCAMRAAPLGLFYHDDHVELLAQVAKSCRPTHNHPLGVEGAQLLASAVSYALSSQRRLDPREMLERLASASSTIYASKLRRALSLLGMGVRVGDASKELGSGFDAPSSVPLAIYAYASTLDLGEALMEVSKVEGDSDTIASMAGAIAGAYEGEGAVPRGWIEALHNSSAVAEAADALLASWKGCRGSTRARGDSNPRPPA